jgi:hypothetical protein
MSGQGNGDQQARESFASILSYYVKNRASLENVPDWVNKAESGEIQVGFAAGTVPSDEQSEELKNKLKEALATQEAITKLSTAEMNLMNQAANSSRAKRREGS